MYTHRARFAARKICDKEALANLAKNFCTQIKVGLQYVLPLTNNLMSLVVIFRLYV